MIRADLAIIGGGAAGLSLASGAAQLGRKVVLAERDAMGGDCLNVGCVPSKALIAAADAAAAVRGAAHLGIAGKAPAVDWTTVRRHLTETIAGIAPHDSVERFEGLGVTVLRASAKFTGPQTLAVGSQEVRAKRIVIATGSRPAVPPVPGLTDGPFLTNETIFGLPDLPTHLIILGGGAIGMELAQAFVRLGSKVTLLERAQILVRENREMVEVVKTGLLRDGVDLREGVAADVVSYPDEGGVRVDTSSGDTLSGSHLLVAAGRRWSFDDLDLAKGLILREPDGRLKLDAHLRTTNRRVYAIGDAAGGPQFTHLAGHHASYLVKRLLFRVPGTAETAALPRVTFTRPEIAAVGLSAEEAERKWPGKVQVSTAVFAGNDKARAEARTDGLVEIVVGPKGRVVGAGIVGEGAAEQIALWCLAVSRNVKTSALAGLLLPYPTLAEVGKRAVGKLFEPVVFSDRTRRLVSWLWRLP